MNKIDKIMSIFSYISIDFKQFLKSVDNTKKES